MKVCECWKCRHQSAARLFYWGSRAYRRMWVRHIRCSRLGHCIPSEFGGWKTWCQFCDYQPKAGVHA